MRIGYAQFMNRIFVIAARAQVDFSFIWLSNPIPKRRWHNIQKKSIEMKFKIDRFSDLSLMVWETKLFFSFANEEEGMRMANDINHRHRNQRGITTEMIKYVSFFLRA